MPLFGRSLQLQETDGEVSESLCWIVKRAVQLLIRAQKVERDLIIITPSRRFLFKWGGDYLTAMGSLLRGRAF